MCETKDEKVSKLTLKGYYEELKLSQLNLVNKIAIECGVTTRQVYNWINGISPVPVLAQEKINAIVQKELSYEN
jgi:Zn-dependent M16 (insulinase) family peptidase